MTYIGVNPQKDLKRFTSVKPLSSYSQEVLKHIKLLSFSNNKTATPFGSFIYRIQKYYGDLDLIEEFTECCTANQVINKFIKSLQKMVIEINNTKLHYFTEFKAGYDLRYDIDIGSMENSTYFPNFKLGTITTNLYKKKLLTKLENNIIQYILNEVEDLGANEYDTINYIFRERKVLRWDSSEILQGFKILTGNKKITLNQAIHIRSHVKIDMISIIDGRLTEVTNFLQLAFVEKEGDEEYTTINIDLVEAHQITLQLPMEIEKLYFSDMFYSPFKVVKRIFSLSRHVNDIVMLKKIIPFVSSNISLLYQKKSEIDNIILVIERATKFPIEIVQKQLNQMKLSISTVIELRNEDLIPINDLIDEINNISVKKDKIEPLKQLKKIIVSYINYFTIIYLSKVGLNPPPANYLPPNPKYDIHYTRISGENPDNPFKVYSKFIEKKIKGILKPGPRFSTDYSKEPIEEPTKIENVPKISAPIKINNPTPKIKKGTHSDENYEKMLERCENRIDVFIDYLKGRSPVSKKLQELESYSRTSKKGEGNICGGYGNMYAHSYRLPLYMNENLPGPKLVQNDQFLGAQTASSYASGYYNRGYGPSLPGVNITNAPLVMNGHITDKQRAGCNNCGLDNFRN